MSKSDPIVIIGAKRTPIGAFMGSLAGFSAPQLGGIAIKAALQAANISPGHIDEVYMGCVLSAALGQAPARQAALCAKLPQSVSATLLNKVCGSGMKAVMVACSDLKERAKGMMVAGGMESMTNSPYFLKRARMGHRMGHHQIYDHMLLDGLEDAYQPGRLMGAFAEDTAERYGFTREAQDAFAIESALRTIKATEEGVFVSEISTVSVDPDHLPTPIDKDETPARVKLEKIPLLKPTFKKEGTVTAASSSSLADGAATLILTHLSTAEKKGYTPLAIVRGYVSFAQEPHLFTSAPVGAIKKLQKQVGWKLEDVDLFEINEAFAVVALVAMKELNIPHEKVNVHGGACALGHPIGASGARILVTLLNALERHKKKKGMASLCIGGGEGVAMAVERI